MDENQPPSDADRLADEAVHLVEDWLTRATAGLTRSDRAVADRLGTLMGDPEAVAFTMRFVDRVARPENNRSAAHQLSVLVRDDPLPSFLAPVDRALLWAGAKLAPLMPGIVIPLARVRMRALVGHLVADADPAKLTDHLRLRRDEGYAMNVNLLGEAILGEKEAGRRFDRLLATLRRPDVDYVSVKISAIASQIDLWAYDDSLDRIKDRLGKLYDAGEAAEPPTFVNLDMEDYEDFDLTIDAFTQLLDERPTLDAGIVLQAYLPDAFARLQEVVAWANARHEAGGGSINIRLVKGANLAMEKVEAEMHGWPQAPYDTKPETDANFKRCLDWALHPHRLKGVAIGVGSHNLFDIAWTLLLARERGVSDRVAFEMLQGMAPTHSEVVRDDSGDMLLYTPVVAAADFDVAIGYLFRRLEENASPENFLHALFSLEPGSEPFRQQEEIFRTSLADRWSVADQPRRRGQRDRQRSSVDLASPFVNEPDSDPGDPANREWARQVVATTPVATKEPITDNVEDLEARLTRGRAAAAGWASRSASERGAILAAIGDELAARRGDLISAMVHEASKTFVQADPEVSEAVDFARYYARHALDGTPGEFGSFTPLGLVAVVPPWNFPVAIPAGGVMAALAAGNAVIFKPSHETPRCAELIAEACWTAGLPEDVLQFVRTPDHAVGQHLVTSVDGVILTGSWETAKLFRGWRPDMRLFAETSGKNALIVTPHADLDLAAADLVRSAFGHSGQKCSAASLGILVGDVFTSDRFRRQLLDATESMVIGPTDELPTNMGPVISPVAGPLERALTDRDAQWLLTPQQLDDERRLWSPGILDDVAPGSWFHETECFGPVLGLMAARDLDHAIALQNQSAFGLTGGIHSLDPHEVDRWLDAVDIGNAYINRHITGAIVQRQPFGGRKRSSIGPGAKAGGPNYVAQLGDWTSETVPTRHIHPEGAQLTLLERLVVGMLPENADWLAAVTADDQFWWEEEFGREHDPAGLKVEANIFRYQPGVVVIRAQGGSQRDIARAVLASSRAGVGPSASSDEPIPGLELAGVDVVVERFSDLVARMPRWSRIRFLGTPSDSELAAAHDAEIDVESAPVAASGRLEMLRYLQEQSVSRTMHRFGNLL